MKSKSNEAKSLMAIYRVFHDYFLISSFVALQQIGQRMFRMYVNISNLMDELASKSVCKSLSH